MASNRTGNYRVVVTETQDMGFAGDQIHLGTVDPLDEALRGAWLENIKVHAQQNIAPVLESVGARADVGAQLSAYTYYLSYAPSGEWSDDAIITASSTSQGGGNLNLVAKRRIFTDQTGSPVAQQLGPIHLWAEATKTSVDTDTSVRHTVEVWGRMIKFEFS